MLSQEISNIICFIRAKGGDPAEPNYGLAAKLTEAESIARTNLIVYDFEFNSLFFANSLAASFLGAEKTGVEANNGCFLEGLLHPVSYQLLQHNARLLKPESQSFDGVFYLKTNKKARYAWVCASATVVSFNALGIPKLIYISFVEVDRALQCYVKLMKVERKLTEAIPPAELLAALNNREVEMLSLVAAECTSKEIAGILNVSHAAVDAARKRLIKKLKVKSVVGLVKIAMALGLGEREMLSAEVTI